MLQHGVHIIQLIRYSRACRSHHASLDRGCCLQGSYWSKCL